jgi:hypothetical protein
MMVEIEPNAAMKKQIGEGPPTVFTPWMALQDQER